MFGRLVRFYSTPAKIATKTVVEAPFGVTKATPAHATVPGLQQAPNRVGTWSENQNPKERAMTGPRFENTDIYLQPNPLSAQQLINEVPVVDVHARKISCDGGEGIMGHPRVWINLDKEGPQRCKYCGTRYQQIHHHH